MAFVTAQGSTFNLPNYTGPLFEVAKKTAKFLAAIGGLNAGAFRSVSDVAFGISTYDLGASDANDTNIEGQNAPAATTVARGGLQNIVEIFHRTVDVSYTKQAADAAIALYAAAQSSPTAAYPASGTNPVNSELDWQIKVQLEKLARMVNYAFLNGSYSFPSTAATPRRTRGLLSAIVTNAIVADSGGGNPDDLSQTYVENLVKTIFDNGGLEDEQGAVILCNSAQKIRLDRIYQKSPMSITVGGVELEKIYTPLGAFAVLMDRAMPQDQLVIASMNVIKPAALFIPGKGVLFEEPLAKVGASDRTQIYGELGLDHGPEQFHGKITNLKTTVPTGNVGSH